MDARVFKSRTRSLAQIRLGMKPKNLSSPVDRQRHLNEVAMILLQDAIGNPADVYALWLFDQALGMGADPNTQRGDALMMAVESERLELVEILVERGASTAWDDYMVLDVAVKREASTEIIVALLQAGALPLDCSDELLDLARERNHTLLEQMTQTAILRIGGNSDQHRNQQIELKRGEQLDPDYVEPEALIQQLDLDDQPIDKLALKPRKTIKPQIVTYELSHDGTSLVDKPLTPELKEQLKAQRQALLDAARPKPSQIFGDTSIRLSNPDDLKPRRTRPTLTAQNLNLAQDQEVHVPRKYQQVRLAITAGNVFDKPQSNQAKVYQLVAQAGARGIGYDELYHEIMKHVPAEARPQDCVSWVFREYVKRGWGQLVTA